MAKTTLIEEPSYLTPEIRRMLKTSRLDLARQLKTAATGVRDHTAGSPAFAEWAAQMKMMRRRATRECHDIHEKLNKMWDWLESHDPGNDEYLGIENRYFARLWEYTKLAEALVVAEHAALSLSRDGYAALLFDGVPDNGEPAPVLPEGDGTGGAKAPLVGAVP